MAIQPVPRERPVAWKIRPQYLVAWFPTWRVTGRVIFVLLFSLIFSRPSGIPASYSPMERCGALIFSLAGFCVIFGGVFLIQVPSHDYANILLIVNENERVLTRVRHIGALPLRRKRYAFEEIREILYEFKPATSGRHSSYPATNNIVIQLKNENPSEILAKMPDRGGKREAAILLVTILNNVLKSQEKGAELPFRDEVTPLLEAQSRNQQKALLVLVPINVLCGLVWIWGLILLFGSFYW